MNEFYPFEGQYFDLDGLRMHYLDEGPRDAPFVVMLHGNPSWSIYYRSLLPALSERYRCIVPDHIGCGLSDKPGDDRYSYTLERRVEDLDRLLTHLEVDDAVSLVLHDWGGMIGMAWAARQPRRIARLALLNTAAFPLPPGKPLPLGLRLCRLPGLGAVLVRGLNLFALGAARVGCKRNPMPAALRRAYVEPYDNWEHRIAVHRFVQDIPLRPRDRHYPLLKQVEAVLPRFDFTPTLICWGMKDFVFDHRFLEGWRQRLPHAEVHRFADAGHYILEDAADDVAPLIRNFFDRHPLRVTSL